MNTFHVLKLNALQRCLTVVFCLASCSNLDNGNLDINEESSLSVITESSTVSDVSRSQLDTLLNGIVVEVKDGLYYFQTDMVYDDRSIDYLRTFNMRGCSRNAAQYYWPNAIVYYKFDQNYAVDTTYVKNAMSWISSATNVSFVPWFLL